MKKLVFVFALILIITLSSCTDNNNEIIEDAKKVAAVKCKIIYVYKQLDKVVNSKSSEASNLMKDAMELEADAGLTDLIEKKYDSNKISDKDKKLFYEEQAKAVKDCK
jgi:uncharacterized lipoprotein YehR (DUF1307 family)